MKLSICSISLFALFMPFSAAWSKEDREIFRVRDELIAHEGPDVTFYEFLGVATSASLDDINRAYKRRTRSLHPDKVKQQLQAKRTQQAKSKIKEKGKKGGSTTVIKFPTASEVKTAVKRASERQARLSIVANVLRGPERDRYDYFLKNGFPTWKGTEYYYNRYRPGLGTAMLGVFVFAGGAAHYLALYMGWKRRREFVERYIKFARNAAWGDNLSIPGLDDGRAQQQQQNVMAPQVEEDEARPVNRRERRMKVRFNKREAAASGRGKTGRRGQREQTAAGLASPQPQASPWLAGPKKRVQAENGKILVVDSLGDVYLEEEDEHGNVAEYLLDPDELAKPTMRDTLAARLPLWAYQSTLGRILPIMPAKKNMDPKRDEEEDDDNKISLPQQVGVKNAAAAPKYEGLDADDSDSPGNQTPSTDSNEDGFELLEKDSAAGTEKLGKDKAKASGVSISGSQKQGNSNKVGRRKGKKR